MLTDCTSSVSSSSHYTTHYWNHLYQDTDHINYLVYRYVRTLLLLSAFQFFLSPFLFFLKKEISLPFPSNISSQDSVHASPFTNNYLHAHLPEILSVRWHTLRLELIGWAV